MTNLINGASLCTVVIHNIWRRRLLPTTREKQKSCLYAPPPNIVYLPQQQCQNWGPLLSSRQCQGRLLSSLPRWDRWLETGRKCHWFWLFVQPSTRHNSPLPKRQAKCMWVKYLSASACFKIKVLSMSFRKTYLVHQLYTTTPAGGSVWAGVSGDLESMKMFSRAEVIMSGVCRY